VKEKREKNTKGIESRKRRGQIVSGRGVREGVRGRPAPGCDVGKGNANGRSHCEVWGAACVTLTP
jgi:hypothetical protein